MFVLILIGLGFVSFLAWLTNWLFALHCLGASFAGLAAYEATFVARPMDMPVWMSSSGGKLLVSLIGVVSVVSPLLIALISFRWWWGLAGYVLGGLGAGLTQPILPGIMRLLLGLLLSLGAGVALVG